MSGVEVVTENKTNQQGKDSLTQTAEQVRQKIQTILQSKKNVYFVFIKAHWVMSRLPPVYAGYVNRYLAANPIPGWIFYGISYNGRQGNKGKSFIYVKSGYEKFAEAIVKSRCKKTAGDLLRDWRVPVEVKKEVKKYA